MSSRSAISAVAAIFLATGCTGSPAPVTSAPPTTHRLIAPPTIANTLTVHGVEDGRTVLLSDGTRIRVAGLAAPEECWAGAATAFAKAFLLDKPVKVDPGDPAIVDEAPLWLDDGTEYALLAVSQGVLRGDSPHDPAFRDAEAAATKAGLGLWGAPCRGQAKGPTSTTPPPPPPAAAPAPKPAPTTTTTPAPVFGCAVNYRVTYRWNGGYNADVTITNTGNTPISGWTLRWTFTRGQIMTDIWNATGQQSGSNVTATNVSYSANIPVGGTQVVGYTGNHRADNPDPIGFSLNNHPCQIR
ncbi:cellulose binding domain-containing protein [Lentzea atacamensis]|uniref:Cellulose binding domain-containing protein n=1 Tax=Lentzea atacamensis TaxID=531938 RepID=A0A316I000_9PSEU|nr:cellulose binding domain-containing protein [Lentzea atacamensis]PWK83782.1 cellulose binding domain-containing protein [Lentzea atacamensis]